MSAEFPTRPTDVPHRPLPDLGRWYAQHVWPLVEARQGIGSRPAAEVRAHAIAALATQHALAERALLGRWVNATAALSHGATVEDVARAMGLDVDEVHVGLGAWADGQVRVGYLTPAGRDELLALAQGVAL